MKTIILSLASLIIAVFSSSLLAEMVTIKGEPVVVEKQGDVYTVPTTATTVTSNDSYYYFTVDNTKRVCYKTVQPGLSSVDLGTLSVKIGQDTVSLHCYAFSPDYFTVQ